jgi:TonB dependent receptor/Carboxypeptidase regulatory-like domain
MKMAVRLAGTLALVAAMTGAALPALAQVSGTVRVSVLDQQSLALPSATVTIKSVNSTWTKLANANTEGEATFPAVPLGQYVVSATLDGFAPAERQVAVFSNTVTPVLLQLKVAGVAESVEVTGAVQTINPESSRTETLVERRDILQQPDADRSGSLAMITNNTPGAYVMHDHLHSRGGHGVSWQIDGVPVPNSNLASVGSQFDPKDVDSLEANRGGLGTNYGDRAYGVFNIVPRSGFEGKRFADVTASYGSYRLANGHLAFGDHTDNQKFAYFASVTGYRTDRGLERVDVPVLHNESQSYSGFTSMLYNKSMSDQFRFVSAARTDRYKVPNTRAQDALGIDDRENADDTLVNFTWLHTTDSGDVLTVSPYYHYNRLQYNGGPNDPLVTNDDRSSNYYGGYASWAMTRGRHTLRFGTDSFAEHDNSFFGLQSNVGDKVAVRERELLWAGVLSAFAEDSFRVTPWFTFNPGLRYEHFKGTVSEHGLSPRIGGALTVPHVGVLRASYSHYYQHPQTSTISGPLLEFAVHEGFSFLPVPGERNDVWELGLGVPFHGWTLDLDTYENTAKNIVDHEVLGNSNILFPLTIEHGRVRAFESSLRSPMLMKRLQLHYAFAYQIAQGKGAITGGLTEFAPPPNEYFFLDHDQRVTLTTGATINLPRRFWASANVVYGSGFLLGNGPDHMPQHTTGDIAVGKDLGERLSVRFSALNVTDALFLTGFENAFAGTHYSNPRELTVQVRYRFHY